MDPEERLPALTYCILLNFDSLWAERNPRPPCAEIVEINAVLVKFSQNVPTKVKEFYASVRPQLNSPKGIREDLRDKQLLGDELRNLHKWLESEKQLNIGNSTFVSWGHWDLQKTLKQETRVKKQPYPQWMHSYINLKYYLEMEYQQWELKFIHEWCAKLGIEPLALEEKHEKKITRGQANLENMWRIIRGLSALNKFGLDRKKITKILREVPGATITAGLEYLLVLDFEATCEENVKLAPCSEIIELPVMLVDLSARKIAATFHEYVTPTFHPQLTAFCTQLTGITQQMVTGKDPLPAVLRKLDQWIFDKPYLHSNNFTFVTCGDWDLASCLKKQCREKSLFVPHYLMNYINIKEVVLEAVPTLTHKSGMMEMLKHLGIPHEGRHHSGIDDVRNICSICIKLLEKPRFEYRREQVKFVK